MIVGRIHHNWLYATKITGYCSTYFHSTNATVERCNMLTKSNCISHRYVTEIQGDMYLTSETVLEKERKIFGLYLEIPRHLFNWHQKNCGKGISMLSLRLNMQM